MPPAESPLLCHLNERVLILDGAMGTSIHALDLPLSAYNGLENCSEILCETAPDAIEQIHRSFLEVGCDAVETNTFGSNRIVLAEFDLAPRTYELNVLAGRIARRACDAFATADRPRFVIGSVGPGTKLVSLRQTTYDTLVDSYAEQIRGLIDGSADAILIETCQDILQTKAAIQAARVAFEKTGRQLPIICQVTIETTGTMLMGTDIGAALVALEAFPEVSVVGLNCATGPQEMSAHVRHLARHATRHISVLPNAGLPQVVDGQPHFPLSPEELAKWLREFIVEDGVNIVGGCCGTTPAHLQAVVAACRDLKPAARTPQHEAAVSSLYSAVPLRQDASVLIVGERCNTNGSRQFKQLVEAGDVESMVVMANEQVRAGGAHVLDVCVDYVGRAGAPDMHKVIDRLSNDVNAPLMLDSTQPDVIEAGLKLAGGKCIINSVNLEDGETKLSQVCRLLRQYGAAVVALTIDEDPQEAMAKTAARKVEIGLRLHDLLTNKYGIAAENIFFDLLTFPITTGNAEDRRLALETLEGIKQLSAKLPKCQFILGVSNVSFGLVPAARVVLNSAFLHEATRAGLTAAIVHAGKIIPRNQVSDERWETALDLIYDRHDRGNPLERFISLFSAGEKIGEQVKIEDLPIEERLKQRIINGQKKGLEADLDTALQTYNPLHIINNFLLDGMKVVGELFGSGQMQLPFVLKSAETMKSAVAHLEPHMDRIASEDRGKIVLATVRGDVHDIGKNLVDIILTNNGYKVYNLGIKQPISNVISAFREHGADAIGLSGLLVKSTIVMREDLQVLGENQMTPPVILGGAALTRKYVERDLRPLYEGRVEYAKDAFEGLRLMQEIMTARTAAPTAAAPETIEVAQEVPAAEELRRLAEQRFGLQAVEAENLLPAVQREQEAARRAAEVAERERISAGAMNGVNGVTHRADIGHHESVPRPPFWGARVIEHIPLKAALGYINETMLFQVQWGFRKQRRTPEAWKQYLDADIRPIYRNLVERCEREEILQPRAIYGYWPCNSDGDDLIIFAPPTHDLDRPELHGGEIARFTFPRQSKPPYWCLADFWRPLQAGIVDVVAFTVVTAGERVSEIARQWFEQNDYQNYLFLHGLGVEVAEALAEYLHKQVRSELGIVRRDAREVQKLFQQGYQGSRYSFGYPACPNLEDQTALIKLLEPERIGVTLSDEYQFEPEQTTSAIISYHPEARYFNVR